MLFSSTVFIYLFLPAVLFIYYLFLRKNRTLSNIFLFIVSVCFYGWGEPKFVFVMLASVALNWLFGLGVHKFKNSQKPQYAKLCVFGAVVVNIGLLFVFKYLNFTENIICKIFNLSPKIPYIALPIGVSFFTFQALSYVVDVYRGKGEVQKNVLNVGLYIAFFPQLIAGPIVRYETVAKEIKSRRETAQGFFDGFARFVIGLSKKVLLANGLGVLADEAFKVLSSGGELSVGFAWLGALAYSFQIFFDFCGYSDMAIGLGRMFGFHFLENFDYPYISASITEFWRRWHISLGTWFRDYVYFPMGGSRVNGKRLVLNLFTVWLLTGIWHGANLTFIVWGLMYFVLLTIEKLTGINKKIKDKKLSIFGWIYTMFFVIIGWVFFRSDSISKALIYIGYMFGKGKLSAFDPNFIGYISQYGFMMAVGAVCSVPLFKNLWQKVNKNLFTDILHTVCLLGLFVLSLTSLISDSYNPFIYFNF